MNTKFAKTRNFVRTHKTALAFVAGAVTVGVFVDSKTLLELPARQQELLKSGGAVAYKVKNETYYLFHEATIQAAQAVS